VRVLVVNAGSSSVKLRLLGHDDALLAEHDLDAPQAQVDAAELRAALDGVQADVVGHRIVHGGTRFRDAVPIDASVVEALRELADLAPLHQPKSLAALDAVSAALPGVPAVACFDTAFHATLPASAATYALPAEWRERWGLRRYGFHGLSHAYASRRAAQLMGTYVEEVRLVTCHLGAGASLCAVDGGRSVDTTMGFTPLEGLVMATRSGSVDPGMLLWLLEREAVGEAEMAEALEHSSGLLALAGSADMRELLERGDDDARLAVEVYVHRLRAGIAAMAASLGSVHALVFTGGVGENAAEIRDRAVEGLGFLGARALVVPAREDLEIARQVRALATRG
jgi:acetate kinase